VCDEIEQILGTAPRVPEMSLRPMVEVHERTITTRIPTVTGLPGFLQRLPPTFRTQTALMLLAGAAVAAVVTIVYVVLVLLRVL